ncbi:MAG: sensor histidine kinase [Chloroflexota bacterium]
MTSSLDACRRVGTAISLFNTSQDRHEIENSSVRLAMEALNAQWAALYRQDGADALALTAVCPEATRPAIDELVWRTAESGVTQATGQGPTATVAVPLRTGEGSLGVLAVHGHDLEQCGNEQCAALEVLAAHLALALENRRLREREAGLWQERNDFVSLVSHEFKTPLTSIKGYAQLVRRRLGAQADPGLVRFLTTIDSQADRLSDLASDIVLYTRLGAGLVDLEFAPTDLVRIVGEAIEMVQAGGEQTQFVLDSAEPALPLVADRERLTRALVNVLAGAGKRSPTDSQVSVGLHRRNGQAIVWIRDRGPTLSAEQRQQVFQRLYQHDGGPFGEAAALGLALAKAVCEAHSGRLWLESEEHLPGTTVLLSLPMTADGD